MKSKVFLTSTFLLFIFAFTQAQGISTNIQGIDLTVSNNSPAPGQTVTIKAESYVSDLNSSNITWKLNNVEYKKGIGVTSVDIQAPALGKKLTVSIVAVTPEGRTMTTSVSLSSGNVDLILESDGYVPPFFQGKMPLVYQNNYRVIAMPHLADTSGKEYDPATLIYQWSKDSRLVQDQSGYGKQVFLWKDEMVPRQRLISVKVLTRDGSVQAEKVIPIEAGSPLIVFYKDDPLYGTLFNNALENSVSLGKSGEISVLAVPFGFNKPANTMGDLNFSWLINSIKHDSLSASQSITLRAPTDSSGSSNIQLTVYNNEDILEKAENRITATYAIPNSNTSINSANTLNNNGL
ncbi:MAG: hypothetical protein WCV79_00500 [Candidatus Paceibacterota bacterium]